MQMPDAVLLPTGDVFVCNGGQLGAMHTPPFHLHVASMERVQGAVPGRGGGALSCTCGHDHQIYCFLQFTCSNGLQGLVQLGRAL